MTSQLIVMLWVEFFILVAPLVFIFADLWSGIRKAKQRGELITSRKFRDTVAKIARYYNVMLVLAVIDALQVVGLWYLNNYSGWEMPLFPWLSFIGMLGIGIIEIKSIIEPANAKEEKQIKEVTMLAGAIAAHKSDPEEVAKAILKYIGTEE